ncbi:hypothetical protein LC574_04425 [Nostoc sp. CHAB 5715]|nr:hypothetical protein [Nostoc sp. CHAB 5715]
MPNAQCPMPNAQCPITFCCFTISAILALDPTEYKLCINPQDSELEVLYLVLQDS